MEYSGGHGFPKHFRSSEHPAALGKAYFSVVSPGGSRPMPATLILVTSACNGKLLPARLGSQLPNVQHMRGSSRVCSTSIRRVP